MPMNKSWYTIEAAAAKYGIAEETINQWLNRGLVRSEENEGTTLVNADDIEQELHLIPSL